mgnify:CR=1 FL=1
MANKNSVKTFSRRFPMYTCRECGKLTRIGDDMNRDAQMHGVCVPCEEIGAIVFDHINWVEGNADEHNDRESCVICKGESTMEEWM